MGSWSIPSHHLYKLRIKLLKFFDKLCIVFFWLLKSCFLLLQVFLGLCELLPHWIESLRDLWVFFNTSNPTTEASCNFRHLGYIAGHKFSFTRVGWDFLHCCGWDVVFIKLHESFHECCTVNYLFDFYPCHTFPQVDHDGSHN